MNECFVNAIEEEAFFFLKTAVLKKIPFWGSPCVHYFVGICAPLDPVLSQLNLVYISTLQYRTF